MKHIKKFESFVFEFQEFKRDNSFFSKVKKGTKDFFGIESKEDRKSIEDVKSLINQIISRPDLSFAVKHIRPFKDGITALISNHNITVTLGENAEILYNGRELDLKDIEIEAYNVYDLMMNLNSTING